MRLAYEILKTARYVIIIAAAVFGLAAVIAKLDMFYLLCIVCILLFIASDAVTTVLQKKLGIPIKYHENFFRFGKHK